MQLRTESSHEEGGVRDWSIATTAFTGVAGGEIATRADLAGSGAAANLLTVASTADNGAVATTVTIAANIGVSINTVTASTLSQVLINRFMLRC